jgi:hypothetical protein
MKPNIQTDAYYPSLSTFSKIAIAKPFEIKSIDKNMSEIRKRPHVISDLIDIATYIAENNLENSDRFLFAAEKTLKQLGQMPQFGK